MKGIDKLRKELEDVVEEMPTINYCELQNGEKAAVYPDGSIKISAKLNDREKMEAEAHELMHLYLNRKGLIRVESLLIGDLEYLALELNNAISHYYLIKELRSTYGIDSELHLREKNVDAEILLEEINELQLENNETLLKGIGIKLYDILKTLPDKKEEILKIASTNSYVNHAFQLARLHLINIFPETSKEEQEKKITQFLNRLGLDHKLFIYE